MDSMGQSLLLTGHSASKSESPGWSLNGSSGLQLLRATFGQCEGSMVMVGPAQLHPVGLGTFLQGFRRGSCLHLRPSWVVCLDLNQKTSKLPKKDCVGVRHIGNQKEEKAEET